MLSSLLQLPGYRQVQEIKGYLVLRMFSKYQTNVVHQDVFLSFIGLPMAKPN